MAATRSGGAGSSCLRAWGRGIAGCSELAGGGGGGVAAASKSVHHLQGQGAAGRDLSPALIRVRAGSMRALGPWPMPGAALPCSLTSILVSQHISSRCLLLAAPRPAASLPTPYIPARFRAIAPVCRNQLPRRPPSPTAPSLTTPDELPVCALRRLTPGCLSHLPRAASPPQSLEQAHRSSSVARDRSLPAIVRPV